MPKHWIPEPSASTRLSISVLASHRSKRLRGADARNFAHLQRGSEGLAIRSREISSIFEEGQAKSAKLLENAREAVATGMTAQTEQMRIVMDERIGSVSSRMAEQAEFLRSVLDDRSNAITGAVATRAERAAHPSG